VTRNTQRGEDGGTGGNGRAARTVVITGATAGVGRAIAREFARRGDRIGLLARGRDALRATRREVEAMGARAIALPTDVADPDAIESAALAVEQTLGPIDIWINNAMVSVFSPFMEMTAPEFERVTHVTYLGCVNGTRAALRRMLPRDHGRIIQVGSALAYRGIPLQSAYCGAKHAIQGFTESVRCELMHEKSNVHICMVQLPALNTPQFDWVKSRLPGRPQPVPPIFQPEVAASAVAYAAEHSRREIYVAWPTIKAVIGNRVAAGIADRRLAATGYSSQQTDEPEDPERPHNLWQPVAGDHGAHGRFDDRAQPWSAQLWANTNRAAVAGAGLAGAAVALMVGIALRRG
jgi:NAD(P)-dependent dehydrogenase (short-subunit alcohol dehydrogenase family)